MVGRPILMLHARWYEAGGGDVAGWAVKEGVGVDEGELGVMVQSGVQVESVEGLCRGLVVEVTVKKQ